MPTCPTSRPRVGFIGLGKMGQPMCRHILRAGFQLTVFDVRKEAIAELTARGARGANSPREVAAQSDIMIVIVIDDAQTREVVTASDGLLQGTRSGTVIALSSSLVPDTCREMEQMAAARGVGVVDAPVALGVRFAELGELTVFVGGSKKDADACHPVFSAFAKNIFYMGPVGAGQVTKTCNNLLLWSGIVACHETLSLAQRLGIAANDLRPALEVGSADSWVLRELDKISLFWPHKDMDIALKLAQESETPVPLMEKVRELILKTNSEQLRELFSNQSVSVHHNSMEE